MVLETRVERTKVRESCCKRCKGRYPAVSVLSWLNVPYRPLKHQHELEVAPPMRIRRGVLGIHRDFASALAPSAAMARSLGVEVAKAAMGREMRIGKIAFEGMKTEQDRRRPGNFRKTLETSS